MYGFAHHAFASCAALFTLVSQVKHIAADYRDLVAVLLCRNGDSTWNRFSTPSIASVVLYVSGRRVSFLVSREGRDITALLHVIANPRDSISLVTLLRGPLVGLSDEGLLRLRLLGGSVTSGLNKFTEIPEPDRSRLAAFGAHLNRWRQDQSIIPLDTLLSRALADCGVDTSPNVESFLQLARDSPALQWIPRPSCTNSKISPKPPTHGIRTLR